MQAVGGLEVGEWLSGWKAIKEREERGKGGGG